MATAIFYEKIARQESKELAKQIITIERATLLSLWEQEKITYAVRNKLMLQLDYRFLRRYL